MYLHRAALEEMLAAARRHGGFRRAWTLASYGLGFVLLRGLERMTLAMDDRRWPGIASQPVERPVFIFANARSGTTLLHRLMSLDEERFAVFKLYQSILWSVSVQRLVDRLDRADRERLGGRLRRVVAWINAVFFSGWKDIHAMGIDHVEEDEAIFALCLQTPAACLLLPWVDELPSLRWFDALDADERRRFLDVYEDALRRRLYAAGGRRTLLSKNVLFAPRVRSMHERFPDARFVYLVRHPYDALGSFLDMFHDKWVTHSPEIPKDSPEARALARLAMDYLRYALDSRGVIPAEQFLAVRYDDLVADPFATVEHVYAWLGVPLSEALRARLERAISEQRHYESEHHYRLEEFGLTREEVHRELKAVFEEFGFEP